MQYNELYNTIIESNGKSIRIESSKICMLIDYPITIRSRVSLTILCLE